MHEGIQSTSPKIFTVLAFSEVTLKWWMNACRRSHIILSASMVLWQVVPPLEDTTRLTWRVHRIPTSTKYQAAHQTVLNWGIRPIPPQSHRALPLSLTVP
jgi:hypothetical protein